MKGFAGFAPSPRSPPQEPVEPTPGPAPLQEDVDMGSGSSGNEANENCSTGRELQGSDCDDSGKELGMQVEPPAARQRWARRRPRGAAGGGSSLPRPCAATALPPRNRDDQRFQDFENLSNSE